MKLLICGIGTWRERWLWNILVQLVRVYLSKLVSFTTCISAINQWQVSRQVSLLVGICLILVDRGVGLRLIRQEIANSTWGWPHCLVLDHLDGSKFGWVELRCNANDSFLFMNCLPWWPLRCLLIRFCLNSVDVSSICGAIPVRVAPSTVYCMLLKGEAALVVRLGQSFSQLS